MAALGLAPVGTANAASNRQTELGTLLAGFLARLTDGWRLLRPQPPLAIPADRTIRLQSADGFAAQDLDLVQNGERIRLEIGDALAIDSSVTLPFAAQADLEALIALWVESESPFPPEETRAIWRISAPQQEKVTVTIAMIEREGLDAAIEAIEAKGAVLASLARRLATGDMWEAVPAWRVTDFPKLSLSSLSPMARSAILGGVIAAASLAVAVFFAEMRVEVLRPSASIALERLAAEARRESQRAELRAQQVLSVNLLGALEKLAETLPDGAWVEQVSLDDGKLAVLAYSSSSTATLQLVSALPGVKNAAIEGAIARDASAGLERFRIVATFSGQQISGLRP
jgi:hypothetical protein